MVIFGFVCHLRGEEGRGERGEGRGERGGDINSNNHNATEEREEEERQGTMTYLKKASWSF